MLKCAKCNKTMTELQFYRKRNGEYMNLCKKCATMHVDNFDESTYVWLLKEIDVPYLPTEWSNIRDKILQQDPSKMTSSAVFGRYIGKMRLARFSGNGFADSEQLIEDLGLQKVRSQKEEEEFTKSIQEKFDNGEISEAEYKTLMPIPEEPPAVVAYEIPQATPSAIAQDGFFDESNFLSEDELVDVGAELTQEDKVALAMKWGRLYKPSEWVELEKKYREMKDSFDIQDSDTEGTLLLICKTYLKMNQALDMGDMATFQQLSRTYDSLRKSSKFTAVQNKESNNNYVDTIGELVLYCEREGGAIPRFNFEMPQDQVDILMADNKAFIKSLFYSDPTLASQVEAYLKKREALDQADSIDSKNPYDENGEVSNEDQMEYHDMINQDIDHDKEEVYEVI